jgi:hypothetical protein
MNLNLSSFIIWQTLIEVFLYLCHYGCKPTMDWIWLNLPSFVQQRWIKEVIIKNPFGVYNLPLQVNFDPTVLGLFYKY